MHNVLSQCLSQGIVYILYYLTFGLMLCYGTQIGLLEGFQNSKDCGRVIIWKNELRIGATLFFGAFMHK